jgi:Tol biopolymer transport system component
MLCLIAGMVFGQGSEYPAVKYRSNYLSSYYLSHAPTTTPWWPCWSPDGKWIAFSMYGSIWKVSVATGEAYELTHAKTLHSSPSWSPDGNWIVYTSDNEWRSIQLEIVNVQSGETRALTHDGQVYLDPAFSPDGSQLAFVSTKPAGNLNVTVRPIHNGDWAGQEVALTRDHTYGRPRLYFSDWDIHIEPSWLKNGRDLVLVSNRGVALGSGNLWRVPLRPDAMGSAQLVLAEQTLYRTRPDVSPEGKRIVYSSTAGAADQFNHLYVIPIEGGQPYKLTFGDYDDFQPRWSPDGEWIAYMSNEDGPPGLYLLEVNGGARRKIVFRKLNWKQTMGTVRVTVQDQATGQAVSVRISGSASDGKLYGPPTAYVFNARLEGGLKRVFYTPGTYTVDVPPGPMTIEAAKGFEYWPVSKQITVRAGETIEAVLSMKRRVDMAAKGWINGSTHVHMNYGGNFHNTPENLMLTARCEGMNIISALVANKDNRIFDWQYFHSGGKEHAISDLAGGSMLLFGEENRPPFWGHTFYIGLRDHLISPFVAGYEGTALDSLYPSNSDLFEKARAQGAATAYVHAFGGETDPAEASLGGAKAFAVDLALGLIDALEWSASGRASLLPLFHAWNNDFHVTPVGGEDSLANMQDQRPVGIIRTYAQLGSNFGPQGWVDAIKQGHTVMSSGPLADFQLNGKHPGDSVTITTGQEILLEGTVWSITPVRKVLVYHNGSVWKEFVPGGDRFEVHFSERAKVTGSGWFSLVAEADAAPPSSPEVYSQAVTNCVRVYVGDGKIRNAASAIYFENWIEKLRRMTDDPKLWRTAAEREHVFAQFDRAARVYKERQNETKP